MNGKNSKIYTKIEELGQMLELNNKDIKQLLKGASSRYEQTSYSMGPPGYPGAFYGTISIYDL